MVALAVDRAFFGDAGGWPRRSSGGDFFLVAGISRVRAGESGEDREVDDHAFFGGDDRRPGLGCLCGSISDDK